jgi:undecaprenyl-diphosphatase
VPNLDHWENALLTRLHRRQPRAADTALAALSNAADNSKLWLGTAAVLAVTGRQGRRAALRGLASLATASAIANGPAKFSVRRRRPPFTTLPPGWLPRRHPVTYSFPSGHSASAAAFATGVALENPAFAVPVGALAAAVAYSRVHSGVHYPSDVLAGIALGVGAAVVVRALWSTPATTSTEPVAEATELPSLADGSWLRVVLNTGAGTASDHLEQAIRDAFPAAEIRRVGDEEDLTDVLEQAVKGAVVLGAAGGDGTISAAADVELAHDLPLLVIPAGTLNHFARALGIDTVADALDAARAGTGRIVDIAGVEVPGGPRRAFVNNSSIGGYPEMVALRERLEDRLGKWPAAAVALAVVLARATPTAVTIDGRRRNLWLLFAGNCCYTEHGPGPISRRRLDDGTLDIRLLDADRRWSRIRLVAAIAARRLDHCRTLEKYAVPRLRVQAVEETVAIARDGEADDPVAAFDWVKAGRLRVYAP